jgi:hypothetical protein
LAVVGVGQSAHLMMLLRTVVARRPPAAGRHAVSHDLHLDQSLTPTLSRRTGEGGQCTLTRQCAPVTVGPVPPPGAQRAPCDCNGR